MKSIFKGNLLLKITSLNAFVITTRLVISLFVQRILAVTVGEMGIAKIGQIRNLLQIMTSTSSLGVFNGVVKYVSEFREDNKKLNDFFSTTIIFVFIGSLFTTSVLISSAPWINEQLFGELDLVWLIRLLAFLPLFVGTHRVFYGVINGLSEYKKYAKIDLLSYVLSVSLLLICLYYSNLEGVLFAIAITPIIQLLVLVTIFGSVLKKYLQISKLKFKLPFAKELLAFTLMSVVSTVLINYIELDIRTMITNKISINEAGYWTAMNFISKNYMAFSSAIFTLYVIPKFARIYKGGDFLKEVFNIYKTILPIFGIGMVLVYLFRETIIFLIYPDFTGLEPLFKWQLLGDFIRLASLVIAHQFLAKKMVKSFIITELISLGLFYFLSKNLVEVYGATGVVMAHFYRYIIYFGIVVIAIWNYFHTDKHSN